MVTVTYNKEYATKYMTLVKGKRYISSETLYTTNVGDIDYCVSSVIKKIEKKYADIGQNLLVVMNDPVITVGSSNDYSGGTGGGGLYFSTDIKYIVTIVYEAIELGNVNPE